MAMTRSILLLLFGSLVNQASACSCGGYPSTCERLNSAQVAFVGTVLRTSQVGWRATAIVKAESIIRGLPDDVKEVEVLTGPGDCAVKLSIGERWLVMGARSPNGLGVAISQCTGSRSLIPYFERTVQAFKTGPNLLSGQVQRQTGLSKAPESGTQVELLSRTTTTRQTRTDQHGIFSFEDLPPGTYEVRVQVEGWNAETPQRSYSIGERGCAHIEVTLLPDNEVSGTVRDSRGKPVAGLTVRALPRSNSARASHEAITDAEGRFVLRGLGVGTYVFAVNTNPLHPSLYAYHPAAGWDAAKAAVVEVAQQSRVGQIDFQLGEQKPGTWLEVELRDSRGQAVTNGEIRLADRHQGTSLGPDREGRARFQVLEGETYDIEATSGLLFGQMRWTARSGERCVLVLRETARTR